MLWNLYAATRECEAVMLFLVAFQAITNFMYFS